MSDFEQETKLHGAFAAFRAESIHDVSPAGTDAVRSTVRHQRKVRNIALGVFALTVMAVPVAAYATLQGDPHGPPPGVPGTTAPATTTPPVRPTGPPPAEPSLSVLAPDLANAKITVPAWPGGENITRFCPAGSYTFTGGAVVFAKKDGYDSSYSLSLDAYAPKRAELDGEPGDEVLVGLRCSGPGSFHPVQLLALKPLADGTVRTLGFVIAAAPGEIYAYDEEDVEVSNRDVLVRLLGKYQTNGTYTRSEPRVYRYGKDSFKQVEGPTRFSAGPAAIKDTDLRFQQMFLVGFECHNGSCMGSTLPFFDGTATDTVVTDSVARPYKLATYEYTVAPLAIVKPGDVTHALMVVTRRSTDGTVMRGVFAASIISTATGNGVFARAVVGSGEDGVLDVTSQRVDGNSIVVTVKTDTGGQESRTYAWDGTAMWWTYK
ncbi:hypothetical protein [Longispora urticae]